MGEQKALNVLSSSQILSRSVAHFFCLGTDVPVFRFSLSTPNQPLTVDPQEVEQQTRRHHIESLWFVRNKPSRTLVVHSEPQIFKGLKKIMVPKTTGDEYVEIQQ